MAPRTPEKIAGLLITAAIILCYVWNVAPGGICLGCSLTDRLAYPLAHASAIHLFVNAWCFLSLIFLYPVTLAQIAGAYIIAVYAPDMFLFSTPTVGLSSVCYALIGFQAPLYDGLKPMLRYLAFFVPYLVVGFLLPGINGPLHLYCFLLPLLLKLLLSVPSENSENSDNS